MTTLKKRLGPSEFYLACRNGDVNFVRDYLAKCSTMKWNPNQYEKIVIAGAFYSNYYIRERIDSEAVDRELSSKDRLRTIVVSQRSIEFSMKINHIEFRIRNVPINEGIFLSKSN